MKSLFIIISLGLIFSNNISGVAYFEYEDSFSLSRTYFTYKSEISDELSFICLNTGSKVNAIFLFINL